MAILSTTSSSSSCDTDHEEGRENNRVIVEDPIALLAAGAPKSSSENISSSSSSSVCSTSSTSDSTCSFSNSNVSKEETKPNELLLLSDVKDPWSVYDRIVCLNLRERVDRYEHMKNELSRIGIFERVQFRFSDRSPLGGTYGCFESHWKAIKAAYDDGLQNLLLFEDDVQFKDGYEEVISDCYNFITNEVVKDWEFLCLNGILLYGVETSSLQTPRVIMGKTIFAHAVCMSRHGMERFLQEYPQPTGSFNVDLAYNQCFYKHYVHIKYNTIVQLMDTLGSDNQWEEITRVNADAAMHKYLQEIYMPHLLYFFTVMNVLLFNILPYHYRPWLLLKSSFAIPRHDIRIFRNGQIETFSWQDYSVSLLALITLGCMTMIRLYCYGLLPKGRNLYKLVAAIYKGTRDHLVNSIMTKSSSSDRKKIQ